MNLHVKNLPAGVFEYLKGWVFIFGVVELNFYIQFTMDNGYYGIELPTIDNLFQNYTFGIHGQLKSIHFIAFGSGIYYENGYDPSVEGVPAEVTVKGMGLVKPDIREDHPLRLTFPIIWPGEFIKIHTI